MQNTTRLHKDSEITIKTIIPGDLNNKIQGIARYNTFSDKPLT